MNLKVNLKDKHCAMDTFSGKVLKSIKMPSV